MSVTRLQAIDAQILDLLDERALLASDLDDEAEDGATDDADTVQWWMEEGAERGLDNEAALEKACRAIMQLRK